jgi:hypothetical protein
VPPEVRIITARDNPAHLVTGRDQPRRPAGDGDQRRGSDTAFSGSGLDLIAP